MGLLCLYVLFSSNKHNTVTNFDASQNVSTSLRVCILICVAIHDTEICGMIVTLGVPEDSGVSSVGCTETKQNEMGLLACVPVSLCDCVLVVRQKRRSTCTSFGQVFLYGTRLAVDVNPGNCLCRLFLTMYSKQIYGQPK